MSDTPVPGWWQASDGRWYPPSSTPGAPPPTPQRGAPQYPAPAPTYSPTSPYGAGPYGSAPFGAPVYSTPPPAPRNGFATAALILGIPSMAISLIPVFGYLAVPFALVGIGIGIAGIVRAKTVNTGKGMAIAGLATSSVAIVIAIAWTVALVVLGNAYGPVDTEDYRVSDENCAVEPSGAITYTATFTNLGSDARPFEIEVEFDTSTNYGTVRTRRVAAGASTPIRLRGILDPGARPTCRVTSVTYHGS